MMMLGTGRKQGFTLIEVMITVTILAVGIIGVIRAYAALINTLEIADCSIGAVCLLKNRIFEVEKEAIEGAEISPPAGTGRSETDYGDFGWVAGVQVVDSSLTPDREAGEGEDNVIMYLNKVNVTVSGEDIKPVKRYGLSTYVEGYAEFVPME